MKKTTLSIILGLALCSANVAADISSDLASGLSLKQVIENAQSEGISVEDAVTAIIEENPKLADDAIAMAIEISPELATEILVAASNAGAADDVVVAAALATGVNITDVLGVTAAGGNDASGGIVLGDLAGEDAPSLPSSSSLSTAPPSGSGVSSN